MVQCFIENRKKKSHDIVCCFFVDIQNLVIKICSLFIPCFKSGVEEKLSRQSGLAVKIIRGGPWRRKPKKSQPGYQRRTKQCGEETLKSATLKTLVRVIDFTVWQWIWEYFSSCFISYCNTRANLHFCVHIKENSEGRLGIQVENHLTVWSSWEV